jgi:chemotaxis protein methyltransferase CheR
VTDGYVQQFRDILTTRFGWRLDDDRGQLAHLLASRVSKGTSTQTYLDRLVTAAPSSAEVRALAEAIAVSETYFFRNPEQFAVLAEVALPSVTARRPAGPIRILSAGGASGEEAYSVAMSVLQVQQHRQLPPIEILAIDISARAIAKAKSGHYSAWALRGVPDALRGRFFIRRGSHFEIDPALARMVGYPRTLQLGARFLF